MNTKNSDGVGVFFSAYFWLKDSKGNILEENLSFLEEIGVPEKRHIYVSEFAPTVIALINERELALAEKNRRFSDWSYYDFDEPENNADDILLTQIGADSISGTNSPELNFSGKGVKVGVIAAENYTFDKSARSLEGVEITELPSFLPPQTNSHPTAVVSQIVGREVTVDETKYFGVVRDAKLYFASAKTTKNVYEAIEEMLKLGVRIINYSAGSIKGGYSDFDRQIDRLVVSGDFLFVTVSGNARSMTSPGRAENAVAVGNLVTKDYPDTPLPPPWKVWCQSEDSCSGFDDSGVHKPDLVAPGAWVGYAVSDENINFNNFGTSFACPWVTGIAAAVSEALGKEYSYLTYKAIILLSCERERVSTSGNPQITEHMRLRSGYGLVNGRRAVEIVQNAEIYEGMGEGEYETRGGALEIMLVFERGDSEATLSLGDEKYTSGKENTLLIKKRSTEEIIPLSVIGAGGRFSVVVFRST